MTHKMTAAELVESLKTDERRLSDYRRNDGVDDVDWPLVNTLAQAEVDYWEKRKRSPSYVLLDHSRQIGEYRLCLLYTSPSPRD